MNDATDGWADRCEGGNSGLDFDDFTCTLGVQINEWVQISVQAGIFVKNNKRTGPNKRTGWII